MSTALMPLLIAGLAGTILALIFATYQQRWSLRVFFLLALRLAIGWHFLFEGLHKIHSLHVGPTDTNRVFSSEPYFKVAPGPLGPVMRKKFEMSDEEMMAKLKGAKELTADQLSKMPFQHQAAMCPEPVAKDIDDLFQEHMDDIIKGIQADAEAEKKAVDAAEAKALKEAKTDAEKKKIQEAAAKDRAEAQKKIDIAASKTVLDRKEMAKHKYTLWVYGVQGRDTKIKGITNDVPMTAPQRLAHIEMLRKRAEDEEAKIKEGLGNGFGIEQKRAAEYRMDLVTAQADLKKDIDSFIAELKKEMFGSAKMPDPPAAELNEGQKLDRFTMWFLVAVGGCLMAGLFTRCACIAGTIFLVMTYLTHPPFPWYPLPPNTEGNPVFINKNVIEGLALLALATFPTGRWLGLDALIARCCGCGRTCEPTT
jgi:uncharacterized membrane protein YphA (DoxX/SURF4 family)